MISSATAIIVVNWNAWEDTARCISACAQLDRFSGALFVVDNGSTNNSFDQLAQFVRKEIDVDRHVGCSSIRHLLAKTSEWYSEVVVGSPEFIEAHIQKSGVKKRSLYLIKSITNAGFGAGNNIGIRLAKNWPKFDLFWCLNSDAIPERDSLMHLEALCLDKDKPLLSGTVLLDFEPEGTIQTVGLDFSRRTLETKFKFAGISSEKLVEMPEAFSVDYPSGASLLINRVFLNQLGMFDERYFLYYEEPDLAIRIKQQPFVCTRAMVYHRGGQSTGGASETQSKSRLADFHYVRSRAILAKKMGSAAVIAAIAASIYSLFRRIRVGRWDLARNVLPALIDGLRSV